MEFCSIHSLHRSTIFPVAPTSFTIRTGRVVVASLLPRSPVGKFLGSVLHNQRSLFHAAVAEELKLLAQDRRAALSRFLLSSPDETCLHRRIARIKRRECETAVEDVMSILILSNFSEIRVPLLPKLSKCIYNGRLALWPSKDWELESIYASEVLEMIREHVTTAMRLKLNSINWATTKIQRAQLARLYSASLLYAYFLKSASFRHHLERSLTVSQKDFSLGHRSSLKFPDMSPDGYRNIVFGNVKSASSRQGSTRQEMKRESLKGFVMGFEPEMLKRCAKVKSKEAVNLIKLHSSALFGDDEEIDETISISFSSLKRLVMEAAAFGSFLWDAEEYVGTMYTLEENK